VRPALAAAALALVAGCSSADGLQTATRSARGEHRRASAEPEGPRTLEAFPFDYAALPSLERVPLTADLPSSSWSFRPAQSGAELNMTGPLVAEIEIGSHTTANKGDMDLGGTDRGHRASSDRYYHLFRQADETGPFGWTAAPGAGDLCGHGRQRGRARWQGYVDKGRTAKGLDYVCYEGPFDPETCGAEAERAWRVTARPLVADAVFGFRVADGECSPPSLPHEERLAVIGPRPIWIGSTAPFALHRTSGARSFTRVAVPIARAGAASAVFDVRPQDVELFRAGEVKHGSPWLISYSVEVVWPVSDAAPSAIAFSSVLSGNTSTVDATVLTQIEH
jgi:hypothetical protein